MPPSTGIPLASTGFMTQNVTISTNTAATLPIPTLIFLIIFNLFGLFVPPFPALAFLIIRYASSTFASMISLGSRSAPRILLSSLSCIISFSFSHRILTVYRCAVLSGKLVSLAFQ